MLAGSGIEANFLVQWVQRVMHACMHTFTLIRPYIHEACMAYIYACIYADTYAYIRT